MPLRNLQIKAKITNIPNVSKVAEEMSRRNVSTIKHDDTFYNVNYGRLKLRTYEDGTATLIRYDRSEGGPKLSNYELLGLDSERAQVMDTLLKKCMGSLGRVVKERKIYIVGQTLLHVDIVENLGNFLELEVVLKPQQTLEDGQKIAQELQKKLGIKDEDIIDCAYIDMLNKKTIEIY